MDQVDTQRDGSHGDSRSRSTFVRVGRFHVSSRISVPTLALRLQFKSDPLMTRRSRHRVGGLVPLRVVVAWRALRLAFSVALGRCKPQRLRVSETIEFPVHGDLALRTKPSGFKVFDLRRQIVITVLPQFASRAEVEEAVDGARSLGELGLAPALLRHDLDERWFETVLVKGRHPPSIYPGWRSFRLHYADPLIHTLRAWPVKSVPLTTYLELLDRPVQRLQRQGHQANLEPVLDFFGQNLQMVGESGMASVSLLLAHGDMCPGNAVLTGAHVRLIDWSGHGYRTPLFDLAKLFLVAVVGDTRAPIEEALVELGRAVDVVRERMARDPGFDEFAGALALTEMHRRLFYLELISQRAAEIEATRHSRVERLRMERTSLKWIRVFDDLEKAAHGSRRAVAATDRPSVA
jgi:thiamine kinase-like enzyme